MSAPKLIVYDFDGVLTNNRVWVDQAGVESVACNRGDGWWINQLRKQGYEQVILTTEENPVVLARARKLSLPVVVAPVDKKPALEELARKHAVGLESVVYVGNEMNDYACMSAVGFPMAPSDAHPAILGLARVRLPEAGGAGVVRHLHDWLAARGWEAASATFDSRPTEKASTAAFERVRDRISESIRVKQALLEDTACIEMIERMGRAAASALRAGGKVLLAGNGGSFADSMHIAAEFVSKLAVDRNPLPAIALGCSNSNLTAIGNDYGYEHVFARELKALGRQGDVFFAISTSGNSPNILRAVEAAREEGLSVFAWSGQTGGKLAELCPTLRVPSRDTGRIQESHILVGHLVCELAEASFLPGR
jgi:D-sedoheptulose 7-phosphate isomerase